MSRLVWLAAGLVLAGMIGTGCEQAGRFNWATPEAQSAYDRSPAEVPIPIIKRAFESRESAGPPPPAGDPAAIPDWGVRAAELVENRVIVYTAEYRVAVANPQAAMGDAEKLASELGGYVQSITEDRVVLRVPADKFAAATARIERMGQLLGRQVHAQDITEEYVDLRMRLASGQAMLKRLEALLEKAPDAKQALEVEREIARVMTEIERLQGRIRLLESQAALSTITIRFHRLSEAPRPALLGRRLPFDWLRTLGVNALLDY